MKEPTLAIWFLAAVGLVSSGCSAPAVQEAAKTVQEAATKTVAQATDAITAIRRPESGSVTIDHSPPIETSRSFATFSTLPGCPSVLQVRSYEREETTDSEDEDARTSVFPMVYLRLTSDAKSPKELVGKTWPAHVSVHFAGNFLQWSTEGGSPVEVHVVDGNEGFVAIDLKDAPLTDAASGRVQAFNGKLVGLLPLPPKPAAPPKAAPPVAAPSGSDDD